MDIYNIFHLDGRRAIITGGSSGIGKRVALAYALGRVWGSFAIFLPFDFMIVQPFAANIDLWLGMK